MHQPGRGRSHRRLMLKNPCACKGSLSLVHEACLLKWLFQRNIRRCELCTAPFLIKEEYGSWGTIFRQLLAFLTRSKRRLLKVIFYSIYLFLFAKRFRLALISLKAALGTLALLAKKRV